MLALPSMGLDIDRCVTKTSQKYYIKIENKALQTYYINNYIKMFLLKIKNEKKISLSIKTWLFNKKKVPSLLLVIS